MMRIVGFQQLFRCFRLPHPADPELHSPVTVGATTCPGSPITGLAATAAALRS